LSLRHRQGDLLFVRQATRPAATLVARTGMVIVAGETTGHAHRRTAGAILDAPNGTLYLDPAYAAQVVHGAHRRITLDPVLWPVVRQREYHPKAFRQGSD
jgi:hypothetical protein